MRVVQEPDAGLSPEHIAKIVHAANRAYSEIIGEGSGLDWDQLGPQMTDGIIAGQGRDADIANIGVETRVDGHKRLID